MNTEFIESIKSAVASDEKFFTVNFGSNVIKIFFEEDSCNWVWDYKYQYQQDVLNIEAELNSGLTTNKLALINYFYTFIIKDITNLNNYISPKIESVLDIGAGIGLFDILLNQLFTHKVAFDLIEVESLDNIEHVRNNNADTKKLENNTQINPVATLKKLMTMNNANNINIIKNNSIAKHLDRRYDLVLSFRSWGFLYDLNLYEEFVKNTLNSDGIVITDLSIYDDSIEKFYSLFNEVILIDESANNKRFLGKNMK